MLLFYRFACVTELQNELHSKICRKYIHWMGSSLQYLNYTCHNINTNTCTPREKDLMYRMQVITFNQRWVLRKSKIPIFIIY